MNFIIKFFKNNLVQITIIVVLTLVIIFLLTIDNFESVPPHIEELYHEQMIPQNKPEELQKPETEIVDKQGNHDNIPPNYGKTNERVTNENVRMVPDNIYRMKTGREGIEQEQFVSIYDSNFGGLLGTSLGLN